MLNLDAVPDSLMVASCASDAWTDVSITCAIRIAPDEFPLLLRRYEFRHSEAAQSSFSLGLPKLGDEFSVAAVFEAEPPSFKDGGSVSLYVDAEQERVLVHLYIE
jgi:hypothetical protein